ncbi:ester cyclase [Pseudooceanicola sp. CBS1P-1]|uniref:Ester cyclase n=1 Tax=Pseudooceanicola albus TaxID=2692189 RepID=A0A6L7FZX6_9RHOB|nr:MULTISPECIES: ester cyclase [Pseudooceanicola]MBT9382451.1 ester cyclase [Pseudooceanicola endophyticus]MXN16992.1 ester cyclase [Pseudooceanicola albus]
MTREEIIGTYDGYIACLNRQDWPQLSRYVDAAVTHNARPLGLDGYRDMLIGDFRAIPDLRFVVARLACDPPLLAAGLAFDCRPVGRLFDVPVNGRRVRFTENVFYAFEAGRIRNVWSVIDTAAIRAQI